MALLAVLFFVTALAYAAVGFGGGSTYNALLVLSGADYRILPSIALLCNLIVVTGGVWRFARSGHLHLKRITPWIVASIPAAWIGGRLPVSESVFVGVLAISLVAVGLRMAFQHDGQTSGDTQQPTPIWVAALGGGGLGFVSGLAGVGGGIFLAPILYTLRWGSAKSIAGAASLFIFVNSLAGLAGQLTKLGDLQLIGGTIAYWPVFPAVLIGGQIGSFLGASRLSETLLRRMTAVLVLYVSVRLLLRWQAIVF